MIKNSNYIRNAEYERKILVNVCVIYAGAIN